MHTLLQAGRSLGERELGRLRGLPRRAKPSSRIPTLISIMKAPSRAPGKEEVCRKYHCRPRPAEAQKSAGKEAGKALS